MSHERTLEFYGFLKGDARYLKAGLQVRILDESYVDRTDPSETFLVTETPSGFIYRVRALGDRFSDTPTDTKTGLSDGEKFYIVFQEIGIDLYGRPARSPDGTIFSYNFISSIQGAINLDLYIVDFNFQLSLPEGTYSDRPIFKIRTSEDNCLFLFTTNGLPPQQGQLYTQTIAPNVDYQIPQDGETTITVVGVDRFNNLTSSIRSLYSIEFPTVKILESISFADLKTNRYFYPIAYIIENNVYKTISRESLDTILNDPSNDSLHNFFYVPLEPGIQDGLIFGPRTVKLASNRTGAIWYRIYQTNPSDLVQYTGIDLQLQVPITIIETKLIDHAGNHSEFFTKRYQPINYGPIIENVIINDGEPIFTSKDIIVNLLVKGGTPQVITISQAASLWPTELQWSGKYFQDCQYNCGYGYGYGPFPLDPTNCATGYFSWEEGVGYDRKVYQPVFLDENSFDKPLHTAFNTQVGYSLKEENGTQELFIRIRDFNSQGFPLIKLLLQVDLTRPILNLGLEPCSIIKNTRNKYTIYGTKTEGSSVWVNDTMVIPSTEQVVWEYELTLNEGLNPFQVFSKNEQGRTSLITSFSITYNFVFTGLNNIITKANADGTWTALSLGLYSEGCDPQSQVYEINAQVISNDLVVVGIPKNVRVITDGVAAKIDTPQSQAPINTPSTEVQFSLMDLDSLKFFGPYQVKADINGNWIIEGIAVPPALFTQSSEPNIEIEVQSINNDSSIGISTTKVHIQAIKSIELRIDDRIIGKDLQPPFTDLNCLTLQDLSNGIHEILLKVEDVIGTVSTTKHKFIVDTVAPTINILSPVDSSSVVTTGDVMLTYFIDNCHCNWYTQGVTPLLTTTVYLDGKNIGNIASGTRIPMENGDHEIRIEVESISRVENLIGCHPCDGYGYGYGYCGYGYGSNKNLVGVASTKFNYKKEIDLQFQRNDDYFNIGCDVDGEKQGEAVLEELRVLNSVSSSEDILADWRLLLNNFRFQNVEQLVLTPQEKQQITDLRLVQERISLPINTLQLYHFENSVTSVPGIDNREKDANGNVLTNSDGTAIETDSLGRPLDLLVKTGPIIDQSAAVNQLAIDVYHPISESIDKDLITETIKNVIPARIEPLITFEAVT